MKQLKSERHRLNFWKGPQSIYIYIYTYIYMYAGESAQKQTPQVKFLKTIVLYGKLCGIFTDF